MTNHENGFGSRRITPALIAGIVALTATFGTAFGLMLSTMAPGQAADRTVVKTQIQVAPGAAPSQSRANQQPSAHQSSEPQGTQEPTAGPEPSSPAETTSIPVNQSSATPKPATHAPVKTTQNPKPPAPAPAKPTNRPAPTVAPRTTPAPDDAGVVSGGDYDNIATAINAERQKAGLKALTYSTSLEKSAVQCAVSNAQSGGLSHSLPGCKYEDLYMAYWKYPKAADVVNTWMNSPGHRAAIMNNQTSTIAIGYAYKGNGFVVAAAFGGMPW